MVGCRWITRPGARQASARRATCLVSEARLRRWLLAERGKARRTVGSRPAVRGAGRSVAPASSHGVSPKIVEPLPCVLMPLVSRSTVPEGSFHPIPPHPPAALVHPAEAVLGVWHIPGQRQVGTSGRPRHGPRAPPGRSRTSGRGRSARERIPAPPRGGTSGRLPRGLPIALQRPSSYMRPKPFCPRASPCAAARRNHGKAASSS